MSEPAHSPAHSPAHYYDPYAKLAPFYDAMAAAMLLPVGGESRFREGALDALDVRRGARVLELGCGTGAMTARLVARGAAVTAIDLSEPMLARARRRAPSAELALGDILAFDGGGAYDRALLSFVLHEMDSGTRTKALQAARRGLKPDGLVGVLDFARAGAAPVRWALHGYLAATEPRTALEVVGGALGPELSAARLEVVRERSLALGTARMIVARPV